MHEEEVLGKAYDARLMRRLLLYLRPYWRSALVALAAILAHAALQLVPPYLTQQAIDTAIPARDFGLFVSRTRRETPPPSCPKSPSASLQPPPTLVPASTASESPFKSPIASR